MTFKQSLIFAVILISILAIGLVAILKHTPTEEAPKVGNFDGGLVSMTRSATVSVGTVSTGIASTSTARRFLQLQNTSGTTAVYCVYSGTTPAVERKGFFVAASSTLALPFGDGPMYNGPINCIASSTVLLLINEG